MELFGVPRRKWLQNVCISTDNIRALESELHPTTSELHVRMCCQRSTYTLVKKPDKLGFRDHKVKRKFCQEKNSSINFRQGITNFKKIPPGEKTP